MAKIFKWLYLRKLVGDLIPLKHPPYIRPGDAAGIVAPAGIVGSHEIEPAIHILEEWGLRVVTGKSLYSRSHFFAGDRAQRLEDLQKMLDDPAIAVIFCARGGYGTIHLLDDLDFTVFKKNPKWIVGFSDITLLHTCLSKRLNIESLHAIMPKNFSMALEDKKSLEYLKMALSGKPVSYDIPPVNINKKGIAEGILTGGNLSIIYSLQATPYEIDTSGKILFIEEVNEYLYRLDRMLMNLRMSGKLEDLKGLIVGGMTEMLNTSPDYGKTANEIIAGFTREYQFPVMFDFPAGHMYPNLPLFMGRKVTMEVKEGACTVSFKE